MTELPGSGLPLLEFDGPETSDLGLFSPNVAQAQIDTNVAWLRQRRRGHAEGDMLSSMSERLYGDPNKWAEVSPDASLNERINNPIDVGAAKMFDDLARLRATTPGDFANFPTSMDDLKARAAAQVRIELDEEDAEAANAIENRSNPNLLGGLVSFAGQAVGYTSDVEGLATLPLSAGAGSLGRLILLEGAIGAGSTVVDLPSRNAQADFLGKERPDPVEEVLMGTAFGGALPIAGRALRVGVNSLTPAGRVENRDLLKWGTRPGATDAERGAAMALGREEATLDTAPAGVNADEHAARVEAAERQLQEDLMVRPGEVIPDVGPKPPAESSFDWTPHRTQGGLRDDAISGLDAGFRTSLEGLIASAPPGMREGFSVFSGFRSIERQQELWDQSDKSGKMVARPGHSKHNHGQAVDLEWNGQRLDKAPKEVQNWVAANLDKFGLTRPMDYEAWHIEPIGARGGDAAAPSAAATLPPITPDAPDGWFEIRNGIFAGESGADWNALFGYANRPGGPFEDVKLTEMTVDQALAFSDPSGPYGQWVARNRPDPQNGVATPMGAYQIVGTTLQAAKDGLGLTGDELMTPELQERLGQWIYRAQGTGAWQGYRGPRDSFNARGPSRYTGGGSIPLGDDAGAAGLFTFDPRTLGVDATTYQFKMGGDQFGVTGRLAGERVWDRNAGIGIMVHERLDGSTWVVDGHQRTGLARKLMAEGHEPITLTGTLYRESDGFTPEMMRAMAAMKNIRAESGSPLDAAKVLREDPSLFATIGSRSRPFMLQAEGLADLAPGPFQAVVNDVIPQNYGAIVGRVIPDDEKLQGVAIATLAKAKVANETQAESITRDIRRLGMEKRANDAQYDMFGEGFSLRDTVITERARVIDRVLKDARTDRALFSRLEQQAETIQEAGNVLNRSENATRAEIADQILARFLIAADQPGAIRDGVDTAARALRNGGKLEDAAADVFALLGRPSDPDADGGAAVGTAGGGSAEKGIPADRLTDYRELMAIVDRGGTADDLAAQPAFARAIAEAEAVPPTTNLPQYGEETFYATREYAAGDKKLLGATVASDYLEDVARALAWAEDGLPPGKIASDRRAVILLGAPASGKSTVANPLARALSAAIIDPDDAKKIIPEFKGGIGANAVHAESSTLSAATLERFAERGDNLLLPKVGASAGSIRRQIADLRSAGYRVDVIHVQVPPGEAWRRSISRFLQTGRLIPPRVMEEGIAASGKTYDTLKAEGAADAFARIDNTPPRGEPRRILEDPAGILPADLGRNGRDGDAGLLGRDGEGRGQTGPAQGLNPEDLPPPRLTEMSAEGEARIAPGLFDDPLEDVAETARLEGLERDLFAALNDPTFDLPIPRPADDGGGAVGLRAFAEAMREETDFVDALKTLCMTKGARP
jgi:Zeta toxin/D-alanyl-D-alanine carboxypeptidase